jgi:hypothetical protein
MFHKWPLRTDIAWSFFKERNQFIRWKGGAGLYRIGLV